jgi:hypothetical protein
MVRKYKYYQKGIVHERTFNDVRNLSIFNQQKIAEHLIQEMRGVIQQHRNSVLQDAF